MTRHTIRIQASGRDLYRVSGAVDLYETGTPISDAAKSILAAGASPSDLLSVTGTDFVFSPMPLAKLAAPHKAPRKSDMLAQSR